MWYGIPLGIDKTTMTSLFTNKLENEICEENGTKLDIALEEFRSMEEVLGSTA